MHLFVGLGNPGEKYRNSRHNIGFMALDRISDKAGGASWKNKFQAQIDEVRLGGKKVFLLKPQTFMNLSGQSVGDAMQFYNLSPTEVVTVLTAPSWYKDTSARPEWMASYSDED